MEEAYMRKGWKKNRSVKRDTGHVKHSGKRCKVQGKYISRRLKKGKVSVEEPDIEKFPPVDE